MVGEEGQGKDGKGGIVVRTGAELAEEARRNASKLPSFEQYKENTGLNYLVLYGEEDVLKAEKEAYEIEVKRIRWANKILGELLDPTVDFQAIKQWDNSIKSYLITYFPKKSARVKIINGLNITLEILSEESKMLDWGDTAEYVERIGKDGQPVKILAHPKGKELTVTVHARATRKIKLKNLANNMTVEVIMGQTDNSASCTNFELAKDKNQPYKYSNISATATTRALNRVAFDSAGLAGMKFIMTPDKKLQVFTGVQKGDPVNLGVSAEEVTD